MDEVCDVYDINCNKTGEVFTRGDILKEGQYQLATNVWIVNSNLQLLIQKRSEFKHFAPNVWANHGGCVGTGEVSINACIREAYEEIGIVIETQNIKLLTRSISEKLIMDNYIVLQEFNASTAVLQSEEVSEIKWVSLTELNVMINNKDFFEYPELPCVIGFVNNLELAQQKLKRNPDTKWDFRD